MFKRLCTFYGNRSFSQSRIWRNIEKVKPDEPQSTSNSSGYLKLDFKPSEYDKKILVWSGKFKSKDDIPTRITNGVLEDAKSRFRIRVSGMLMVGTLFLCAYYIWSGKKRAHEGYSMNTWHAEKYKKALKEEKN